MSDVEKRTVGLDVEVRANGRARGVAMVYGDVADLGGDAKEVFETRSLKASEAGMFVDIMHDPSQKIDESPSVTFGDDRVEVEFRAGADVRKRIRSGELGRMSIQFKSKREKFDVPSLTRRIYEAELEAISLVDNSAYYGETSVELRNRQQSDSRPGREMRQDSGGRDDTTQDHTGPSRPSGLLALI